MALRSKKGEPIKRGQNPFRKKLLRFVSDPEIAKEIFEGLRYHIKKKDKFILAYLADQAAGKAKQSIDMDGEINLTADYGYSDEQIRKALELRRVRQIERARVVDTTFRTSDGGGVVDGAGEKESH